MEMTDELALLKELNAANKCPTCGGSGKTRCKCAVCQGLIPQEDKPSGDDAYNDCPICNGTGAKVEALNRTEWVTFEFANGEKFKRVGGLYNQEFVARYGLPYPTVEELQNILPPVIGKYNIRWWKSEDGKHIYEYSWVGNLNDCLIYFKDDSALIALIKLTLWWIKQ